MRHLKIEFFNCYVRNLESKSKKYRRLFAAKKKVKMYESLQNKYFNLLLSKTKIYIKINYRFLKI